MIWLVLLATIGCDKGADPTMWTLADGTEVHVGESGAVELWVHGVPTFALADGAVPEVRTFTEEVGASLGQWTFDRVDETRIPLAWGEVTELDDGLSIALTGAERTATLEIRPDGDGATALTLTVDGELDSIAVPVRCDPDGTFHGFGAQYHETDQRGEAFDLFVQEQGIGRTGDIPFFSGDRHTTYFPMPWYLDARGFGVLVDTHHRVEVDLCATDPGTAWLEVVDDTPVQLTVMHGPEPLDVIEQLGDHVGRPTAPPDWAFGTWICTQGGTDAVLEQADLLEAEGIPATALWVQDWTGGATNIGGGYGVNYRWEPDEGGLYADLPGLIDDLHARDLKVFGYVNPFVDPGLPNHFDEMEDAGMLPVDEDGQTYLFFGPRGEMTQADLTNPEARDYIADHLRAAMTDIGLDGWMADFSEWLPIDAVVHDGSDGVVAHNRAPRDWQSITREVMDEVRPDDFVMFARAGWTGVHEVAQIHWIGDQEADFEETDGLPTVVPAMINLGLSGQPHVTHDIAGFSGGPSTEELYLRWTELGAFTPFMRTHDGDAREDNWRFDTDAATLAHFGRFARIHDALRPELEALSAEAAATGAPMVRHLMLDAPDDPETWPLSDQYLLGPDLLVAPVLHEGQTERELYLPAGTWFHVWSGEPHDGPGWITVQAPLGSPPVFSRGADRPDLREIQ